MGQLASQWTDFDETWYLNFTRNSVEKIRISLKSDKNNGNFTWIRFYNYDNISQNSSQNEKFLDKVVEKIKTHILCSLPFFFFFRKSHRLWDDVEKYDGDGGGAQMTSQYGSCALQAWKARLHARTLMHTPTHLGTSKLARTHARTHIPISNTAFHGNSDCRTRLNITLHVHCLCCYSSHKQIPHL
jgi:hypothetical protein